VYLRSLPGLSLEVTPTRAEMVHPASGQRWRAAILAHPVALEILRIAAREAVDRTELIVRSCQGRLELLPTASAMVSALSDAGVLVAVTTSVDADNSPPEAAGHWAVAGWGSAFDYHRHTTALQLLDYGTAETARIDKQLMAEYMAGGPPPDLYLERQGELLEMPPPQPLRTETTVGQMYSQSAATKARTFELLALSDFCYLSFGETGRVNFPVTGRQLLKTVPSGGSRHPTEAYLLVLEVAGVPRGVYHYSVRKHALVRISSDDPEAVALASCLVHTERLAFTPAVVVVLTSRPARSMFRYRESRSYRVLHLDAGHVLFNAALVARSFGWSSYRAYSPTEEAVESHLQVNGISEFTIGTIGVGLP
jgi:SagB-type dehydrogenase family enzyme